MKKPHVWVVEYLGFRKRWIPCCGLMQHTNRKQAREQRTKDKNSMPDIKFRIAKYVREA